MSPFTLNLLLFTIVIVRVGIVLVILERMVSKSNEPEVQEFLDAV